MKMLLSKLKLVLILLLSVSSLNCKKSKNLSNITESSINFNDKNTGVVELDSLVFFTADNEYKSYFSGTAVISQGEELMIVVSRGRGANDYEAMDLVSKKFDIVNFTNLSKVVFKENDAKININTPSFLWFKNKLQLYHLKTESFERSYVVLKESLDSGRTWLADRVISNLPLYHGLTNDRVLLLSNNRILIPLVITSDIEKKYGKQQVICYLSDDGGRTWLTSSKLSSNIALMEPSVAEISPGKLLMVIRSSLGKLLFARSDDNGLNWTAISKSKIDSPVSTAALYRISDNRLLLIWNHNKKGDHLFDRKPLSLSISEDGGLSWSQPYSIANKPGEIYTSPALLKYQDKYWVLFCRSTDGNSYDYIGKLIKLY